MSSHELPAGEEILNLVRRQVALGPRYPGSAGHGKLRQALRSYLKTFADQVVEQNFSIMLQGQRADCSNLIGLIKAESPDSPAPLLLGTHFDTRLIADRESDLLQRREPILGANDGGSGTAVLLYLLPFLRSRTASLNRDVLIVFFDAEDVGDIDHHPYSLGARIFVHNPAPLMPAETLVLDMVGGQDMVMDIDAHILSRPPSLNLTHRVFQIGLNYNFQPFTAASIHSRSSLGLLGARKKLKHLKYIISDQYPFLKADIPSCLLIDLDYPEWHTHQDLPEALSPSSLAMIAEVLKKYVLRFQG